MSNHCTCVGSWSAVQCERQTYRWCGHFFTVSEKDNTIWSCNKCSVSSYGISNHQFAYYILTLTLPVSDRSSRYSSVSAQKSTYHASLMWADFAILPGLRCSISLSLSLTKCFIVGNWTFQFLWGCFASHPMRFFSSSSSRMRGETETRPVA